MKKIVFTAKDGMCPKYDAFGKRYYIQDRFFGGNYEYALMSRDLTTGEVLRFPDNRMLAAWLNGRKERVLRWFSLDDYPGIVTTTKEDDFYKVDKSIWDIEHGKDELFNLVERKVR